MEPVSRIQECINLIYGHKKNRKSIGLVPTMGALHQGHLSLIERSILETDITVVSIFVNPTQFNDQKDLLNYPRNPDGDLATLSMKLRQQDIVFTPDEKEIYPEKDTRIFDFGHLDKTMEGKYRKGHFNGVAQIVSKLLELITPDKAYFGEKDFQQLIIIKHLVKILHYPVEIVPCPIIREEDGLALSSRNQLLSPMERKESALISKTLFTSVLRSRERDVEAVRSWVIETLNSSSMLQVEYFDIVNSTDLKPVKNWNEKGEKIGCIAVKAGKIRLIDNVKFPDF
ncbi:MAG: pantoate--beta-alanine ligase [Bacteroidales bacterium]|nr:MAG: pantoate--beta-alanine ligase [Bacteroidales bacterium]